VGTKKGCIYNKGAPQTFGVQLPQTSSPGSATVLDNGLSAKVLLVTYQTYPHFDNLCCIDIPLHYINVYSRKKTYEKVSFLASRVF